MRANPSNSNSCIFKLFNIPGVLADPTSHSQWCWKSWREVGSSSLPDLSSSPPPHIPSPYLKGWVEKRHSEFVPSHTSYFSCGHVQLPWAPHVGILSNWGEIGVRRDTGLEVLLVTHAGNWFWAPWRLLWYRGYYVRKIYLLTYYAFDLSSVNRN